jgi:hypothetical protein
MNRRGTEPYARWCERPGRATSPAYSIWLGSVCTPLPFACVDFIAGCEATASGFCYLRPLLKDPIGFRTFIKAVAEHQ